MADRLEAVSYTHLNLKSLDGSTAYKIYVLVKTDEDKLSDMLVIDIPSLGAYTVSYTHLDVYKRQLIMCASWEWMASPCRTHILAAIFWQPAH